MRDLDSYAPIDPATEGSIPTANGERVVFQSFSSSPEGCEYIRIVDRAGYELVYWDSNEWAEDPKGVMGAIMAAIQTGVGE